MNRFTRIFLFFALSLTSANAKPSWLMIVDAGSSGSRLHVYEINKDLKTKSVKEIFSQKVKPGIAAYIDHPNQAYTSLLPLFAAAEKKLLAKKVTGKIATYIYATGGMRLLTNEKQQLIYSTLKTQFKNQSLFNLIETKTLSGIEEGFFSWIAANYLLNTLHTHKTIGSLELGGASTQIAFALTQNQAKNYPHHTFTFGNTSHFVFAKSYLGLGIIEAANGLKIPAACRPIYSKNNNISGQFNLNECKQLVQQWVIPKTQSTLPAIYSTDTFAATSEYYRTAFFFKTINNFSPLVLTQQTEKLCKNAVTPDSISAQTELSMMCFNGIYISQLLQALGFSENSQEIKVYRDISQQEMSWCIGAALYLLSTQLR